MKYEILITVILLGLFATSGCGSGEEAAYDINFKGNEDSINGIWSGKYKCEKSKYWLKFTMKLEDGRIAYYKDNYNKMTSESGYIGMYSLDKSGNFIGRLNSRAPGAPINLVTDEIKGTIEGSGFSGKWYYVSSNLSNEKTCQCVMSRSGKSTKSMTSAEKAMAQDMILDTMKQSAQAWR